MLFSQMNSFSIISVWGKKSTSKDWRIILSSTVRAMFVYMSAVYVDVCKIRLLFVQTFFLRSHSPSDTSRLITSGSSGLQTTALHDIVLCYLSKIQLSLWISYSVCLVRKKQPKQVMLWAQRLMQCGFCSFTSGIIKNNKLKISLLHQQLLSQLALNFILLAGQ